MFGQWWNVRMLHLDVAVLSPEILVAVRSGRQHLQTLIVVAVIRHGHVQDPRRRSPDRVQHWKERDEEPVCIPYLTLFVRKADL